MHGAYGNYLVFEMHYRFLVIRSMSNIHKLSVSHDCTRLFFVQYHAFFGALPCLYPTKVVGYSMRKSLPATRRHFHFLIMSWYMVLVLPAAPVLVPEVLVLADIRISPSNFLLSFDLCIFASNVTIDQCRNAVHDPGPDIGNM